VAFAGAKSMWEAYNQFYAQRDPFGLLDKQKLLESQIKDKSAQLDLLNSALVKIDSFGTDNLASFQVQEHQRYVDLEGLIATAKREVDLAEESAPAADKTPDSPRKPAGAKPASLTAEDIEKLGDPQMRQLLANQRAVETDLKSHQINGYGPNNPTIQIDENKLVVAKGEIGAYVETFNRDYRPMASQAGRPSELPIAANPAADLAGKRKRLELLTQQFEEQKSKLAGLATEIASATSLKQQINNLQGQLDTKNSQFEELRSRQILMKSQMSIVSMPSPASEPSYDKRRQLAAIGFVGGFIFPVCVALLIGLLDGRFRFSDETNSDLGGVPLLGILPNLPDLLSDPEQAATAAHCVHQIRTILQITGSEADRRAFAITSASPGDGKTSLCLALGLSFAASGSRTLLIDADLIGGGLTSRLNISQDHGVLEAMASRDILPYIRSTDVKDLSIIPVGMALGGYTGTIAPAAVRRLVNEAKRHFDVVVIDTGPILGSIEASPVAVAADGVVICVSRGQQRQLVDRAVSHLISIGAKLVGVVFNRAQGHDFEHSVSRMSMKQLPATNGNGKTGHSSRTNGERIGPVAKAVASSVRKEPAAGSEKKTA
jgi:capsular exopolysaccharide synthesis family protein